MEEHRWLVRSAIGQIRVVTAVSRAAVLAMWPGSKALAMGDSETQAAATKRAGWEQ